MTHNIPNRPEKYEHWDLAAPDLPPRSTLYQLRPIGIGIPETECLTSYLARLANAHHLTVGSLLLRFLIPKLNEARRESRRTIQRIRFPGVHAANGPDTFAADLVSVIQQLTLITEVQWTTLIVWGEVFSRIDLLRRFRAWCAGCYTEQRTGNGPVYDLLLWTVASVKVCVKHKCPLIEKCPSCQKRLRPIQSRSLPGFCPFCLAWLGASGEGEGLGEAGQTSLDMNYELWVSEQIGSLIAAAPRLSDVPARQNVKASVNYCCDILIEGNCTALAHLLGILDKRVQAWYRGASIPPIGVSVRLSYLSQVPLFKLLTNPAGVREHLTNHMVEIKDNQRLSIRSPIRSNYPASRKVHQHLEAALREIPPPPLPEVVHRLGYKQANTLYVKYPELCRQIKANYRAFKRAPSGGPPARGDAVGALGLESQRQMLEQAVLQPYPESLAVLGARMGYKGSAHKLSKKFPDICRTLLNKRQQYQSKRQEEWIQQCHEAIDLALVEELPPSLKEVSRRAGVMADFLYQHFPDDCNRITRRFAEHCKKHREERLRQCRDIINVALTEDPPPSFKEISCRVNGKINFLYRHFPSDYHRISERRIEYRRKEFQDSEARLKQALLEEPPKSVRQLAGELGMSSNGLVGRHPELCHLISAQFKSWWDSCAEEKRRICVVSTSHEA
jgi:hypothetical protein